jgi:hypothetical protein
MLFIFGRNFMRGSRAFSYEDWMIGAPAHFDRFSVKGVGYRIFTATKSDTGQLVYGVNGGDINEWFFDFAPKKHTVEVVRPYFKNLVKARLTIAAAEKVETIEAPSGFTMSWEFEQMKHSALLEKISEQLATVIKILRAPQKDRILRDTVADKVFRLENNA